jgi:hypothetical protein
MGVEACVLLILGGHSQQAGDEGDLPGDVAFGRTMHLSLAHHVPALVLLQRPSCGLERKEAQSRFVLIVEGVPVASDTVAELLPGAQSQHLFLAALCSVKQSGNSIQCYSQPSLSEERQIDKVAHHA